MENIILNIIKKFRFIGLVLFFVYGYQVNAQCGTPVVGCPGTDFGNFGFNSDNDAATIEYDNFVATFHSTVVRDADGNFQVWGEEMGHHATNVNSFTNLLDPIVINNANFHNGITGTPLKAALGGFYVNNVQGILLTTTGLHAWGRPGVVLNASLTTNWRMQAITVDGNTNGLPTGVTPAQVKMMFVTGKTIAITTCDGDVYVLSQRENIYQPGGSSTAWTRVRTNETGNPFLTNVIVTRGANGAMFALRNDNTLWTWGDYTYLGDNTAADATRNYATQMESPIPAGTDIKMIGATYRSLGNNYTDGRPSYYVLDVNGNLYAMGRNNGRQLGDWTTTDRLTWIQPRYTSAVGPVMDDIKWISPLEHDWYYGTINVINEDAELYNWGDNNNRMLGRSGSTNQVDPGIPDYNYGTNTPNNHLAVESGGHTTMITMKCIENFGYAGHRIRGSMGNGSNADATEAAITFATAAVQICGAETIPNVIKVTVNMNSDGTTCEDGTITLIPDISGGTYSFYTAVPGSPGYDFYDPADPNRNIPDDGIANLSDGVNGTPGDSENTLSFTGPGRVKVVYSVTGDCGPVSFVTADIIVLECEADLEITKSVAPVYASVGDTVVFTIAVENHGPQRAKEVEVTDTLPTGYTYVSHTVSTGTYNSGTGLWTVGNIVDGETEIMTITATVNIGGPYLNTATATSSTPGDDPLTPNTDTAEIELPGIEIEKDGAYVDLAPIGEVNTGDEILYTFMVTNTGNVTLTNVTITETEFTGAGALPVPTFVSSTAGSVAGTLLPGESATYTATYVLLPADLITTYIYNLATATGTPPNGPNVTDDSEDPTDCATCPPLAGCDDCTIVDLSNPSIEIEKDGAYVDLAPIGEMNAGDEILYTFTVTNTGNVTLTNVTVTETEFTGAGALPVPTFVSSSAGSAAGTLVPGESATYTATYILLPADIAAAYVYNLATATGTPPAGGTVTDDSEDPTDCATCPPLAGCVDCTIVDLSNPSIEIEKDGAYVDLAPIGEMNAGDEILYTFTVTNTGNVTLTNVTVTETEFTGAGALPVPTFVSSTAGSVAGTLLPGESATYTATYTLLPADIAATYVYNLATATGTPPAGGTVTDDSEDPTDCATCPPLAGCDDCTGVDLSNPAIEIEKDGAYVDTNADGITNVGDHINYTFTVTNTGNMPLSDIVVNDPMLGGNITGPASGDTNGNGILDTDETWIYTAVYSLTQDDIDGEYVYNRATATGTPPTGADVTDDSEDDTPCTTCPPNPDCPAGVDCSTDTIVQLELPGINITKDGDYVDTNADGITNVGDEIHYTFTVTNTGNVPLSNVVVNDPMLGGNIAGPASGDTNGDGILDTDETWIYTAVYSLTQDDIDGEYVYNRATATGTPPTLGDVTDDSTDDTPCTTCPLNPDCPAGVDCSTDTIVQLELPGINITKDGDYFDTNTDGITNIGDHINYTFTVTNTGNVPLSNVVVNDPMLGGNIVGPASGDTNGDGILDTNETWIYTAVYALTQDDIDAEYVYNRATATGTPPTLGNVTDDSEDDTPCTTCPPNPDCPAGVDCSTDTIVVFNLPGITITKDGDYVDTNVDGITNVGDEIHYTFTVTNTGNVPLSNVVVNDPMLGGNIAGPASGDTNGNGILDTDETWIYTAVYSLTQDDIDGEYVYNRATATGTPPTGADVTDDSEDDTPCTTCPPNPDCPAGVDCSTDTIVQLELPGINITKDGDYVDTNADGITNVGDEIHYTFTVTNTGNVPLSDVVVNDPMLGGNIAGPASGDTNGDNVLDLDETWIYTATYVLTQEDIDGEYVYNRATATGTPPTGANVTDDSEDDNPCTTCPPNPDCPAGVDCDNDTIVQLELPGINITKDGDYVDTNTDGITNIGDEIHYTFTVTNTGNVPLSNVVVNDPMLGGNIAGPASGDTNGDGILDTDETWTYTAVYALTQDDIDSEYVYNRATTTGTPPTLGDVTDNSDDPTPCTTCPPNPDCPAGVDCSNDTVVFFNNPEIELLKSGVYTDANADGEVNVGDTIVYSFIVTNTGNVVIDNISITDPMLNGGSPIAVTPSTLAPGESGVGETTSYAITQEDINNGGVWNLATVTGTDPNGEFVTDDSEDPDPLDPTDPNYDPTCPDCTFTGLEQDPKVELWKEGTYVDDNGDNQVNVGDTIVYDFVVINTGNVTLTDLEITDPMLNGGAPIMVNPSTLIPGQQGTATATYVFTQGDIEIGQVLNLAFVEGTDPNGDIVDNESEDPTKVPEQDPDDPTTIVVLDQNPRISLTKEGFFNDENGDEQTQAGETITYTFVATNVGNIVLYNVTVTEMEFTGSGATPVVTFVSSTLGSPEGTLLVGESAVYTATYTIVADDIRRGSIYNQAIAEGQTNGGIIVAGISDDPNDLNDLDMNNVGYPNDPTVIELDGCEIRMNNGISPNDDGFNDYLHIRGLGCYATNNIEVFNRWGVKVFEEQDYDNSYEKAFKGYSNGRSTLGDGKLPAGHYWVVLKLKDTDGVSHESVRYVYVSQ